MSVTLFIRERSGDNNLSLEVENREIARKVINRILSSGGYWADATINDTASIDPNLVFWNDDGTIFIPFHRIDYMEIRD